MLAALVADASTSGPPDPPVSCAVVGVAAPFQRGKGILVGRLPESVRRAVPHLADRLGWLDGDPAPPLGRALGVPATADNDSNLAALGEAHYGAGRGLENFVYVKVVDGLGAGLILDGKLYRGAQGLAGELAHVQVRDDGPWCACGGRGCLRHSFGASLRSMTDTAYGRPLRMPNFFRLAALDEPGTRRILADAGRAVGRVLADVCMILNPEAIVVDGSLGPAAPSFVAGLHEMIDRHTPSTVAQALRLRRGELGDQAEILGAVALARTEHLAGCDPSV